MKPVSPSDKMLPMFIPPERSPNSLARELAEPCALKARGFPGHARSKCGAGEKASC